MENIKRIYRIKTKQSYKREMIGVQIWGKEINSERERERESIQRKQLGRLEKEKWKLGIRCQQHGRS